MQHIHKKNPIVEAVQLTPRKSLDFYSADRWILASWYLILISEVLSGPFRYFAEGFGLALLVYFPKVLALVIVIRWGAKFPTHPASLLTAIIFLFFGIIAVVHDVSVQQVGFGLWIYLYFLVGIAVLDTFRQHPRVFVKACLIAWSIAVFGVLLNSQVEFAWSGFGYMIGSVEVEGAREWTTYNIDRLAGFGRTSINTAGQILALSLVALPIVFSRSRLGALLIVMLSLATVVLTTAKSVAVAYLVCLIVWFLSIVPWMSISAAVFASFSAVLLPFSTLFIAYRLAIGSWWGELLLQSFEERLILTWPLSLEQIMRIGDPIFGRGLGGVGSPQKLFSNAGPSLYDLSFTDSFSVYLYGTFGVLGVVFLLILSFDVCKRISREYSVVACIALAAYGSLLTGAATDLVEGGIPAIFVGLAVAVFASSQRKYLIYRDARID